MSTEGSGASRGGGDEFHNEDAFLVEQGLGLFVVCDGASRSPAGEIAARIAVDAVQAQEIVRASGNLSPSVLASRIVSAAHRRDPSLDATAIVVRVRTDAEPGWLELSVPPRELPFGHAVAFSRSRVRARPGRKNHEANDAGDIPGNRQRWKGTIRGLFRGPVLAALAVLMAVTPIASGAARPGDADVTDWVEEAIAGDPRVRGEAIETATRDGIVTLSGSVPTLAGRRYAVLAAQKTVGVLGVIDQLEIDASHRTDAEVAAAVLWRIENSQYIEGRKLEVTARTGVVRLVGEVGSGSQRTEAELLASEVAGVRGVENYLSADVDAARSDAQIEKDVIAALRRDVYLGRLPIQVAVKGGDVTLTGLVGSAYERARAGDRLRWVYGVRGVTNELQVEWWEDRGQRTEAPAPLTDAELAATVTEQLRQDVRVDASRIQVAADRGRVSLLGNAASLRQKRIAEEDTWNVAGVGWVANELVVVAEARPDAEIVGEIRSAMAMDSVLGGTEIEVRVKAGVVTLEGRVASGYQRIHAGAIASRTRAVERLENRLVAETRDDRADDELAEAVMRRLRHNWRTAGIGELIRVRVEGGVVTLTGTVDRWSLRRSAGRIAAATSGVQKVRNRIVVQPYPYPWQERQPAVDPEGTPEWDPYYFDYPTLPWIAGLAPPTLRHDGANEIRHRPLPISRDSIAAFGCHPLLRDTRSARRDSPHSRGC